MTSNEILNLLTVILLALLGGALIWIRAAVRTSAEEAASATVKKLQWPGELARELQKTRGVERQELRYKSYGKLWKELRPLAIYDDAAIDREAVGDLSKALTDWYFSECGGLLLTPQSREFYFALQDLLQSTSTHSKDWGTPRCEAESGHGEAFREVLENLSSEKAPEDVIHDAIHDAVSVLDYFSVGSFDDWQKVAGDYGKKWREGIKAVAKSWDDLNAGERFATLQQAGSKLRTSLVTDVESRLP